MVDADSGRFIANYFFLVSEELCWIPTMKRNLVIRTSVLLLCSTAIGMAGEEVVASPEPMSVPDAYAWLTPSLNITTRYEFRDLQGLDASHALTSRARLGLLVGPFSGLSLFGELEGTGVAIDDYRSNPTPSQSTRPNKVGNTPIADPENFELNQLWAEYKREAFAIKVGRQRIVTNNSAFVGNVGWRQNEQTFDAVTLAYADEAWKASYTFSNRVQRIFGKDSNDALPGPPLKDFEGEFHFIDALYTTEAASYGGYVYLIDVDNNANVGRSNTFGAFTKTGGLHAELAFQTGNSAIDGDYEAVYSHINYTKSFGKSSVIAGFEYLGDDFKTPFATVHAFNGFADNFVLDRIGLRDGPGGSYDGLERHLCGLHPARTPWRDHCQSLLTLFRR